MRLFNKTIIGCFALLIIMACQVNEKKSTNHEKNNPQENTLFTLVPSETSGITFSNTIKQTKENNHMVNVEFISGGGVAVGDINNDKLPDLFFTGNQVKDQLYLNQGNFHFKDISTESRILEDSRWSSGVTMVDIDQDGDLDIYVCRNIYLEHEISQNLLYINNSQKGSEGVPTFTEQAEQFGLADNGFSAQALFFDANKDGLIDMYLVNQPPSLPGQGGQLNKSMGNNPLFSDKLYINKGNGKFEDKTNEAGVRNFAFGLSVSTGDFNNDTWPDLYVTNDFDVADHLYINQKDGTFKDEVWSRTKHISNFSMGSDVADYDNDGHLDIMVLDMMAEDHKRIKTHMSAMKPETFWNLVETGGHYQYMFNTLQRNNGNGTFSNLAQLAGVTSTDWSWAPLLADFDNDGWKDLFVSNGVVSNNRLSDLTKIYEKKIEALKTQAIKEGKNPEAAIDVMDFVDLAPTDKLPNYIYKNNGDLTFTKTIEAWGLDVPTLSNGAAYADFDGDGDLDLVVNNINENAMLFKNNTSENNTGNFIRFQLIPKKDQVVYGVQISLYQDDQLWQMNEIANARGYMSKSEDIAHFGVGTINQIEKVVVDWNDGTQTTLNNISTNQLHIIEQKSNTQIAQSTPTPKPLFKERSKSLGLDQILHQENAYDDYIKEVLLPHKMSEFGPPLAVGDVNGDKREDFYLGGSAGFSATLFIQNANGTFDQIKTGAWTQDSASEDMDAAFVDIDNDDDLDLFVVSGGNEFGISDPALQDRLYLNNGKGKFTKSTTALPPYLESGSCVAPQDYDKDGDIDLFVGGRLIPGQYPNPTSSYLLENTGGTFKNVTETKAPEFKNLGLLTAASWTDYNSDGQPDLVVVGEWMPVTIFTQVNGKLIENERLENTEGWYYSLLAEDIDGDGDDDFIAGNLGRNYKYKASADEPFEVYSGDLDNNGKQDIVLSYYEHGDLFPVRGRECSSQQMPTISEKFPTYEDFGNSNLENIYGTSLEDAINYKAKTFASSVIMNNGSEGFEVKALPNLAQVSSINNIIAEDYDKDGHKDLIVSGNLYQSEIETPRNDASIGLFLKGDGKGNFIAIPLEESGFYAPYDAKDMKSIKVNNQEVILISNNSHYLQAVQYIPPAIN